MFADRFLVSVIVCVLVLFVLCVAMLRANARFAPLQRTELAIPEFSVDVRWEPYPRTVDIENKYDCNARSLRKCDINDPTTLFGCRELTVRCHHFDRDVTLHEDDGEDVTIPKNATPTEGYALAITDIAEACNAYHGDLVLVAHDADSQEYMMVCACKNPGYIGNEHLLGNCESVFVCDGKIDSINKPLAEINCECRENEHSVRYESGLPTCKPLLVHEANAKYPSGWTHLVPFLHARQLPIANFNPTIRDNVRVTTLLDPCRSSLHDMSIEIPNARYDSVLRTCAFVEEGYPVESQMLTEPRTTRNPADVMARIGAGLVTGSYEQIRVTDQIAGKRKLAVLKAPMTFDGDYDDAANVSRFMLLPEGTGIGEWSQLYMATTKTFVSGRCEGSWPSYTCKLAEYYSYTSHGIPMGGRRRPPGTFLWGTDNWVASEKIAQFSIVPAISGVTIKQGELTTLESPRLYGLRLTSKRVGHDNGLLGFVDRADYELHLNAITPSEY